MANDLERPYCSRPLHLPPCRHPYNSVEWLRHADLLGRLLTDVVIIFIILPIQEE